MNDIIKPFDFDLTKKLHGHVRVETRSRWTGKVIDSQEKDNLITNIQQQLLEIGPYIITGNNPAINMSLFPLYSKGLGGLLIFNGTLTESASNTSLPADAKLVAFAGQDANSADANRGSYNASESVYVSNGFTTVWDFLTSQANGTIASLARTTSEFAQTSGYYKYDNNYPYFNLDNASGPALRVLGYDETNEYLYLGGMNLTVDGVTYPYADIYRTKFSFDKISLYGGLSPKPSVNTIKSLTSSDGSAYAYQFFYDKYSNNFLYYYSPTLHIIAMDGTHSTKTLSGSGNGTNVYFAATENYYWRLYSGTLKRFEKSNIANVTEYTVDNGSYIVPCENDIILIAVPTRTTILYPDGTTVVLNRTSSSFYNNTMRSAYNFYFPNGGGNLFRRSYYLGTIANLASPVTKTSSQTMKITYTLTEA